MTASKHRRQIRYAVVGLGHIAQVAVLPAFAHARKNSQLTALVSDDPQKLKALGRRYRVDHLFSYREYDECLGSGMVDAVYIALPNHLHADYSVRAARAGIHVLCEKPMAVTEKECRAMIRAAEHAGIKLMIAYRLHFEEANMTAVRVVRSGKLGDPRFFTSAFSMQVRPDNIRTDKEKGGGTLYDIGIYCINAARYLFGAEPTEVFAFSSANKKDSRFKEIDEMTGALLRFPDGRLAEFSSSFGAADVASYRVVGTKGDVRLDQAYEYVYPIDLYVTIKSKTRKQTFRKRDQFAPELEYFSNCILNDRTPEPSGMEGIADVRIIEALYRSAQRRRPVKIEPVRQTKRPSISQIKYRPAVDKPALVHAESAAL
ncbi:MAG TPA: Gfo/Idh/MocA family oxidoreductase [Candidatus Binatia bacterium]|jgi:glucose-fructose oxidoreductase